MAKIRGKNNKMFSLWTEAGFPGQGGWKIWKDYV